MKRTLSFLLAMLMLVGVLAGCSDSGGEASQTPDSTSQSPTPGQQGSSETPDNTEAPGAISLPLSDGAEMDVFWNFTYGSLVGIQTYSENTAFIELERRTGVKINWIHPVSEQESFNMMVASGDLSDIVYTSARYWVNGLDAAVEDDYVLDLNEHRDECYNYFTYLESMPQDVILSCYTDTGYMPGFSQMRTYAQPPWSGPVIRQDWLDELGLDMPETFDELTNVAREFKASKNTVATVYLAFSGVFEPLSQSFNAGYNFGREFFQVDDVVKYGPITDECKEYIEMLKMWYDEGIIESDFYVQGIDMAELISTVANEKTGIWRDAYPEFNARNLANLDPDCRVVAMPLPTKNRGEVTHIAQSYSYNTGVLYGFVASEGNDPMLAIKWLDYGWTEEGAFLMNWGIENETYTLDADGNPQFTDIILKNDRELAIQMIMHRYVMQVGPWPTIWDRDLPGCTEDEIAAFDVWHNSTDYAYNLPDSMTMTAEENTEYSALYNDINTYVTENLCSFVAGLRSMDEWDAYIAQVESMNIGRCIELKQASYDRYLARGN